MKKTLFVVVLVMLGAILWAYTNPEPIDLNSDIYTYVDIIYSDAGLGTPSNSRPWTVAEANLILSRIDSSSLSPSSKILYEIVKDEITKPLRFNIDEGFSFNTSLEVNPEYYAHNNENFKFENDWIYDFEKRKHFLRANIELSIYDFFYTSSDLLYGYGRYNIEDDSSNANRVFESPFLLNEPNADLDMIGTFKANPSLTYAYIANSHHLYSKKTLFSFPHESASFDFWWPKRAIFSIGKTNWNFGFYRDRINWGNSNIGNMVIDNHVDFHNSIRFSAYSDKFKYDFVALLLETNLQSGETVDPFVKNLFAHRLEFRILKKIVFAISEDIMYQAPSFDLKYLNPSNIYHNINNRSMFNAIAHAELDYQITKGLNLYGQFAMDQATAPNESSSQDQALGYLAGLEFTKAFNKAIIKSSFEVAKTDPLLYRRDQVDFLMVVREFAFATHHSVVFDYIGFPYGGDAIVYDLKTQVLLPKIATFDFNARYALQGQMNIFASHNKDKDNNGFPNTGAKTLSGDKIKQTLSLSLSVKTTLNDYLSFTYPQISLRAELDYVLRQYQVKATKAIENKQTDLQLVLGAYFKF